MNPKNSMSEKARNKIIHIYSIYTKFNNRLNLSLMINTIIAYVYEGKGLTIIGTREFWGTIKIFCILNVVVVSMVYAFIKTNQMVHLNLDTSLNFTLLKNFEVVIIMIII